MPKANKKLPVNLDLRTIRLPIGGVVSILHRVSGVLLVLAIPALLYVLQMSVASADGYTRLTDMVQGHFGRLGVAMIAIAMVHHFLAGLRHLLLDLEIGIDRNAARHSAWWVMAVVGVVTVLGGWFVL